MPWLTLFVVRGLDFQTRIDPTVVLFLGPTGVGKTELSKAFNGFSL